MAATTQTPDAPFADPNDPYAVIRQRALTQAGAPMADQTAPTAPATSSTSSYNPYDPTNGYQVPKAPTTTVNYTANSTTNGPQVTAPTVATAPLNANYNAAASNAPLQATSLPTNYNSAPVDPGVASKVAAYIQANGLKADQSNPASLTNIVNYLRSQGVNAQVDATDQNGHTGGILVNGQPYQLIDGSNNWTALQPWQSSGGSGGGGSLTAAPNPFLDQLKQMLMARINADGQPVNESDANIAAPLQAARDEASRSTDQERTALAERLYAQGDLNSNSLTQGIQQSAERNATGLSSLRSTLIVNELNARRNDLQQAYQLAVSAGDAESARAIQLQLASLNAEVQRESLGVSLAENSATQNANTVTAAGGQ